MFEIFLALFMAFACPAHSNHNCDGNGTVTTQDAGGPGDYGHVPPPPPPPPPGG